MNRTTRLTPGVLALALFAGACGGGSETSSETTQVPVTEAPTTAAPSTEAASSEGNDQDSGSSDGGMQSSVNNDEANDVATPTTTATEESTTTEAVMEDGQEIGVFSLNVGDCIADVGLDAITSVTELSCDTPHIYEIYHAYDIPGDDYPGEDEVIENAQSGCLDAFEPFVGIGYNDSELDVSYLYPTMESWTLGNDREVLCMLVTLDGSPRTGSAQGLGI